MSQHDTMTLCDIVEAVDLHPDYRVLRRIPFMPDIAAGVPDSDRTEWIKGLVVDTETTGLDTSTAKITELGMSEFYYHPVGGFKQFGRARQWFNDPGEPISAEITAITGITDEMVAGKKIDRVEIMGFMKDTALVVAHNAAFDRPIIEREFSALDFDKLPWACSQTEIDWKGKFRSPSSSLQVVAWNAGFFYDAHRAHNDCAALVYLLGMIGHLGTTPLQMLLDSARKPWARLVATGAEFEKKDALKARGYSWNPDRKVWWIDKKDPAEADLEQSWLKQSILNGREPGVQIIRAADRYSIRVK